MIGLRVELVPHEGWRETKHGREKVSIGQDIVVINETYYDDNGNEKTQRFTAGYCKHEPGAIFLPIVNGLPNGVMLDIKKALAERDAKTTGKSEFDFFQREIGHPPPILEDDDDDSE